ncbi:TolC family protein [Terracidiphilus gabretensis]|uniref:TolC family protein n=1 Tax=Terracidiphilus gabretensis TaxID=1577687 RepID=UPI00071B5509|nr:TolC family protein [Terracidiphilus gabretensis]
MRFHISALALLAITVLAPAQTPQPVGSSPAETPITLTQAEQLALKNNPRITAAHLVALASAQQTREQRSAELPQINADLTAVKAEDATRIGAGTLNPSTLYTHAGAGGTLSQLITDFGHTHNLILNAKLREKAQQQSALATEQDILLATDQAFYRLLDAQSLLNVAKATVQTRTDVLNLTQALTKSNLKSTLDLNIAAADLSQAQLLQLDTENSVASARAVLAALLATPDSNYRAAEDSESISPPPALTDALIVEAHAQRPDLAAAGFQTQADQKFARAQQEQRLPSISAAAIGGVTPVRPDGVFTQNWYAAAGVNLSLPLFTGFRISAETKEAHLREEADEKRQEDLSNSISRDVRVAALAAQTAYQRIGVTQNFEKETTQALNLAHTRYQLGLSSIVELSQAQLQSTQASVDAVNARFDYFLSLRSLAYARGLLAP